jgi:hypothetical protein
MDYKQQAPVFGESESCFPRFVFGSCIDQPDKRVKENFACLLETNDVLGEISASFLCAPLKLLSAVNEGRVHRSDLCI